MVEFQGVLGASIRERRLAAGLSQTELAMQAGVTQASLSNYERGKREIPLSTLVAVAHVLGIRVLDLLGKATESSERGKSARRAIGGRG